MADESFAQEFCKNHPGCSYYEVICAKYRLDLEANMVDDNNDLELIRIPVKKWED